MTSKCSSIFSCTLAFSIATALCGHGCARQSSAPAAAPPPRAAAAPPAAEPAPAPRYTIDESKLPPLNRFLRADLDDTKAACADLAAHVNARWLAANPIPADRTTWGSFETLIERSLGIQRQLAEQAAARTDASGLDKLVGDLYATGMDEAAVNAQGLRPLEGRLAAIDALDSRAALVAHLRATFARGEGFLFSFGPEADFDAPDRMMAYAAQGGLGLPDKSYYFDADKKEKLAAYEAHVRKVLELSGVPATETGKAATDVLALETRLAGASRSSEEIARDVSLLYHPVTLAEADQLTPAFSWTRFFATQGLEHVEKFSLAIPAFHAEVNALLEKAPLAQWKSYLRFHTVDGAAPYLSDAFVQEHFAFYAKALRGQKEIKARWKRVLETVNGEAGDALGQLYVGVAFSPQAKARMEELVANLRAALKVRLEKLTWMGDATRAKALEKWAAFTPKIGYPDKWRDWSGARTGRASYLENVFGLEELNYKWRLGKIGKPVDRSEWRMSPQTVNASYNPLRNEITFPAAILAPPFFDAQADDALNYGAIGAVIGHEMIHGYDDQGSRFGPTGRFENWWSPADAKGFAALTAKLVAQFDGYEALPGKKVNGKLTLGENIADLGGLTVAYDALQRATAATPDPKVDGMTRDQRFFAAWATVWRRNHTPEDLTVRLTVDPHAPALFRAVGVPSNLPTFAMAFQCQATDKMVRAGAQQIVIW